LLDLVGAQGVAVYFDNNVFVIGKTPEQADIQDLIEWKVKLIMTFLY